MTRSTAPSDAPAIPSAAARPHPRLFFDQAQLAALRARCRTGVRARARDRLMQVCAALLEPGHAIYFDYRERKKPMWRQRHGIFQVLPRLNALAVGYAFTGDTRFGDAGRDALLTIIDHGLADVEAMAYGVPTFGWRHGPGHDKGKFAQSIAWVYDMCHDRFDRAQQQKFCDYAKECIDISLEHHAFDTAQVANNRGVRGILARTWLALAIEGDTDLPQAQRWLRDGCVAIEKHVSLGFDPDGAPYEGPAYAGSLAQIAAASLALHRRGMPNLLTFPRYARYLEYLAYELLPGGGSTNNLNDARMPCGSVAPALHLMGTPQAALIPWLIGQLDLHPMQARGWLEDLSNIDYRQAELELYLLLWWRDDAPVRSPVELGYPLARPFLERGVVSMRTGWSDDDWLVTHFCGRQELYCHRQADQNHVAFYAGAESFLVDAGYGDSDGDPMKPVDRWYKRSEAHNVVLIDGEGQRGHEAAPGWTSGRMLDFVHTDAFTASLGDAAEAAPAQPIRRSLRRIALLRQPPQRLLVVIDAIESDGQPFTATANWQTDRGNQIELLDGARFVIRGRADDCLGWVLWPTQAQLELVEHRRRPQVRVSATATLAEMVTVFCPVKRGKPWPQLRCERTGEAAFAIAVEDTGGQGGVRLSIDAAVHGPAREVVAPRVEVVTKGAQSR